MFLLRVEMYRKDITRYHEQAGVEKIRIHDLRHSHASLLINYNINVLLVSKRLGHSKVDMTLNTYAHLYNTTEDKMIKILNKI